MTRDTAKTIRFLYTEIGRGHPFYLDGIIEAMARQDDRPLIPERSSVFDLSHGLSSVAWHGARWLYRKGSSGGPIGCVYARLRNGADYNKPRFSLKLLGRDIRAHFQSESAPLVVAHPTLVGILTGRANLIYQHGEIAVPPESVVLGAAAVLVPTVSAAEPFVAAGYSTEQVRVTGLCIDPSLCDLAESSYRLRQARLLSDTPLTGFYVSSGAEPKQHVAALIESITSTVRSGGKAFVLARRGGRLHRRAGGLFPALSPDYTCCESSDEARETDSSLVMALYDTRKAETELTESLFDRIDYLVAPAHERSLWALGLGLPMFPLVPSVGPFAPLNLKALVAQGVATPLDSACPPSELGRRLERLRQDGSLRGMSEAGWGKQDIGGFSYIARFLAGRFGG